MDGIATVRTEKDDDENSDQSEKTDKEVVENDTDNTARAEIHNKSLMSCYICNESFSDLSSLRKHRLSHRKEKYFKCDECKFCCSTQRRLEFHKLEHKASGIFRCERCGKCFKTSFHLYRHDTNVHAVIKPYGCSDCEFRTYTVHCLKRHELKHKLTCPVCNEHFLQHTVLSKHMTQLHFPKLLQKPHKCSECGASYTNQSLLIEHQATHAALKSFQCKLCDKFYPSDFALRKHVYNVHRKEKKHECKTCGHCFEYKYLLARHEIKHSGERKYVCSVCGKTYTRLDGLKLHMTLKEHTDTHSGEKNFCCKICGKTFKLMRSLLDHESTHSDDIRPTFECDKCKKKFRAKRYLREHINHIHGPEDKRRERLQKRVQQERAREHRKRMEKLENTFFLESKLQQKWKDTKCFERNDAAELNSLISRQIKTSKVPKNKIKTDDKNLSTLSTVSVDKGHEKTGKPLTGHSTGKRLGTQKLMDPIQDNKDKGFENFDIKEVSYVMDVDDNDHNDDNFASTNDVVFDSKNWFDKDTAPRFDDTEDQEFVRHEAVKPMSSEDNKFKKSNTTINNVIERTVSFKDVFVSKKPELWNQNVNNRELRKSLNINMNSNKHIISGMLNETDNKCQDNESSTTSVAKSFQPLEAGVMNQASQELTIEKTQNKRKNMQIPNRIEPQAKRSSKSETFTKKTQPKVQKSFKCDTCSLRFRLHDTLVMHLIHVHDVDERKAKYFGTS